MNLTSDPWIPAIRADGRRELFSLDELFFQAHELRDLAVKPHERIALMRLLLCITQAALEGPADEADWEACEPIIQGRVRSYLDKWKGRFELFGDESRFLQFSNLKPGKETDEGNAATKLDLALATGNNTTLFDNAAGEPRELSSSRAALNLLTFQCFAPGGRIGVAKWNGQDTAGNGSSNHAPCTPSSMLHTFVLGHSLLNSLHHNLVTREQIEDFEGPNRWGEPVWEQPVLNADNKAAVENARLTFLGRLVPLSRAVFLGEDSLSITLANGLDHPIFPVFREVTATVIRRKDELALLPASTSRGLWRQLAAVTVKRRAGAESCGPLALNRSFTASKTSLWVGAMVTDKAKIEDVIESSYSLPAGMFTEFGRLAYEKGVAYAEEREGFLVQAVKVYASTLMVGSPSYDRARQFFWTRVEQNLTSLFDLACDTSLAADLPQSSWGKSVQASSSAAFERSCPRRTPRQIHAYTLGLLKLNIIPKSTKPTPASHE